MKKIPNAEKNYNYYANKKKDKIISIYNIVQKSPNINKGYNNLKKLTTKINNTKRKNFKQNLNLRKNYSYKEQQKVIHYVTDVNLGAHFDEFKKETRSRESTSFSTSNHNNEGKVKINNFISNFEAINICKEFILNTQNLLNALKQCYNIEQINSVKENIPFLEKKITQLNKIFEKQDKNVKKIIHKDDNDTYNKNIEETLNLKILNKFLQKKMIKNLESENKKYKNLYFKMKNNYDSLYQEHTKMKNDLQKNNNLNKYNQENYILKSKEIEIEINNNRQIIKNLDDAFNSTDKSKEELMKENEDLKKKNFNLILEIFNIKEINSKLENDKGKLKLLLKDSFSDYSNSSSYNKVFTYQQLNGQFSEQEKKEIYENFKKFFN